MAITTVSSHVVSVNAIQGTLIADNAITAVHIATNAVSGTLIADNAITAVHVAQNSITVTQLADDCVESDKIADGVITTNHLNKAMISSQTEVTPVAGDFVLLGDTSDSNNLKKAPLTLLLNSNVDISGKLNLSGGTMTGALVVNHSEVLFDNTGGDFTLKLNTNAVGDKNEIIMGDSGTPLAKFGVGGTANDIITGSDGQDFNIGTAGGGRAINFSTDNFASVEMKLDGGNIGIGIAPRAKLDVYQQTNRTSQTGTARGVLHLQDGDTPSNNELTAITFESNSNNASSIIGQSLTNSGSSLFFGTSNSYGSGVTNTAMTINHAGNVIFAGTINDFKLKAFGTSSMLISEDGSTGSLSAANYNTGFGHSVFNSFTSGDYNTAIGFGSMGSGAVTGEGNVGMGMYALRYLTSGSGNVALGWDAAITLNTGTNNVAVGKLALKNNQTGGGNVAIGLQALEDCTVSTNVAVGYQAMMQTTSGERNTGIGYRALSNNTNTEDNTAVGYDALLNCEGQRNVAVGAFAGDAITSGTSNVAIGASALSTISDSGGSVAVGRAALNASTVGGNVAVGYHAMVSCTTGDSNVCMGYEAGEDILAGNHNNLIGYRAGMNINSGSGNVIMGSNSAATTTTASNNVYLGYSVGSNTSSGSHNVAIGYDAGNDITSGRFNVCIGGNVAGDGVTTGEFNNYIGYLARAGSSGAVGEIVNSAGNRVSQGKGNNTGFIDPNLGGVYQGNNSSSWSTTSDERIKKNIVDNNIGLEKIKQITVKNFEYRTAEEITDLDNPEGAAIGKEGVQVGVIAQEIEKILPNLVTTESTGVKSVNPDNLTWYLINAVKELSAKVQKLEDK